MRLLLTIAALTALAAYTVHSALTPIIASLSKGLL